jgi:glycosyltransferase involved in cell wall biosynthesis
MSKQPTLVHVSWLKRDTGSLGGVEKFAAYLRQALTDKGWGVVIMAWEDFPGHRYYDDRPNPDKADLLGRWIDGPAFGFGFDVAVSDGYWGIGISSKPVVPVIHGTWAEFNARMGYRPTLEQNKQGEAFNAPNAFPVACAPASAREVRRHHGRSASATILHGIDLGLFHPPDVPLPPGPPWIVLEAAGRNEKKGARIMPEIAHCLGAEYDVRYLKAGLGEEPAAFRRGHIFLHPTRHEGNAYACLEALGTDLPVVTSRSGLFEDIPWNGAGRSEVGYSLPVGSTPEQYAAAVRACAGGLAQAEWQGKPRAWAERHCSMTEFAAQWDIFLRQFVRSKR